MAMGTWGGAAAGVLLLGCLACAPVKEPAASGLPLEEGERPGRPEVLAVRLEEIAEIERAGRYFQGLALRESTVREEAGDYGGAVIAAYKELAWAYGLGKAGKGELEEGLGKLLELYREDGGEEPDRQREDTLRAARGTLAFLGGCWAEAEELLRVFGEEEEPDAFSRWILLVCALEGGGDPKDPPDSRGLRGAYGAIRARYENFPEYWFRGARFFTGLPAAEYAERCINLCPQGPFAGECRLIIARGLGIVSSGGAAIRSRGEIEAIISRAAATGEPELLEDLFPLIALPDNAYTLYALGALRALAQVPRFRDFFDGERGRSSGRLAERLAYIARG